MLLIVLFATLPSASLLILDNFREHRDAYQKETERLLQLADAIARNEEKLIGSADNLLVSVAHFTQQKALSVNECDSYLRSLHAKLPHYANIVLTAPSGEIRCGSRNYLGTNLGERDYFKLARQRDGLVASDYLVSKTTGKPVIVFARAIRQGDTVHGIAIASLGLDSFTAGIREIPRPQGTTVVITDRNGTMLAREPALSGLADTRLPIKPVLKLIQAGRSGHAEADGVDGVPRQYEVAPVRIGGDTPYFVVLGSDKEAVTAKLRTSLLVNLGLLGTILIASVLGTWRLGERLLLAPLRALTAAIKKVAAGETGTQTGLNYKAGEIGELARHFDEMSAALQKRAEEAQASRRRIEHLAHYDHVTGLPNRILLMDRLAQQIDSARNHGRGCAVLFIDLDRFKALNDTLGRTVGDKILFDTGRRIAALLPDGDTAARLSADEFVCVLADASPRQLGEIAARILAAFAQPFMVDGRPISVAASAGLSLYPDDAQDAPTLLQYADAALRRAKTGRQKIEFFNRELDAKAIRGWELEGELRTALAGGQLQLFYQPKVCLKSGRIVGAEALIRWRHPEKGMISPADFIPLAERSRLIVPIGAWVIAQACRQGAQWLTQGLPPINIAVNISAEQFLHGEVGATVQAALRESGFPAQSLELEITEGVLLRDVGDELERLRKLQLKLSIDDFGTGYSSLAYLQQLKVDKLKVDQSFVRDITTSASDKAIAAAIVNLAQGLGLTVVAEGIETREAEAVLKEMGCDQGQGYLYSRPVPPQDFEALLRAAS